MPLPSIAMAIAVLRIQRAARSPVMQQRHASPGVARGSSAMDSRRASSGRAGGEPTTDTSRLEQPYRDYASTIKGVLDFFFRILLHNFFQKFLSTFSKFLLVNFCFKFSLNLFLLKFLKLLFPKFSLKYFLQTFCFP